MTIRNAYEFALIECNKLKAPALLLEDYIYLFNKAIQQYVNSVYNRAEYNQQSSDDLGWLQKAEILTDFTQDYGFNGNVFTFELPKDYVHLLNCKAKISGVEVNENRCGINNVNISKLVNCSRLTANLDGGITNNYYNKPSHIRPYYYIINRKNQDEDIKSGDVGYCPHYSEILDSDGKVRYSVNDLKEPYDRTSNQSTLFIEIHLGESNYKVEGIQVSYVKSPMYVSMTQDELLALEDNSQVLEFPDYVCYEIINIFVKLLLENASDPRLSTNMPINQSIASGS